MYALPELYKLRIWSETALAAQLSPNNDKHRIPLSSSVSLGIRALGYKPYFTLRFKNRENTASKARHLRNKNRWALFLFPLSRCIDIYVHIELNDYKMNNIQTLKRICFLKCRALDAVLSLFFDFQFFYFYLYFSISAFSLLRSPGFSASIVLSILNPIF